MLLVVSVYSMMANILYCLFLKLNMCLKQKLQFVIIYMWLAFFDQAKYHGTIIIRLL